MGRAVKRKAADEAAFQTEVLTLMEATPLKQGKDEGAPRTPEYPAKVVV